MEVRSCQLDVDVLALTGSRLGRQHGAAVHGANIHRAYEMTRALAGAPASPFPGQALLDQILAEMSVGANA